MSRQIDGKQELFEAAGAFEFELAGEVALDDEVAVDDVGAGSEADRAGWSDTVLWAELEDIVADLALEGEAFRRDFLGIGKDHRFREMVGIWI